MKVEEYMLREYPKVGKNETLQQAVRIMEKYGLDRVLVFEKDSLVGVMTLRDIMSKLATLRTRTLSTGRLHVSSFMTINPVTIGPDASISEAFKLMIEKGISGLPVVKDGEVVGLLTKWSLLELLADDDTPASKVASVLPYILRTSDTLLYTRKLFLEEELQFLPVVDEEGNPVGFVNVEEIAYAVFAFHDLVPAKYRKERIHHILVEDIMRPRTPVIDADATISDAVKEMKHRKSRGVALLKDDRPIGIVTLDDLAKYIVVKY